ncbi:site-2 protease family protein [Fulvivirgaceae bacterium BMA10]|uniref:Site-2 protease family protein n=1 Tax=Splendidivirga corallicola TaxID=3051826 RepID=A0ABT8KMZ9_9BACT|nr:site-2 protease family protein [Fulvivirgaceae bacterium BMA10]
MEFLKEHKTYFIQAVLFVSTIITTTLAGSEWVSAKSIFVAESGFSTKDLLSGFYFSLPFLGILTVHEFGHYITARLYNIKVTLPYYIPFFFVFPFIGTMGAVIRLKESPKSRKEFFDVGIAGPLAGFIAAIILLYYGFTHLPPAEYIFQIHPEYEEYGLGYANEAYKNFPYNFKLGNNLVFDFFENYVVEDTSRIPNAYEIMHYPFLFAGYLALFFTALNLLPIGQLDGGHVVYGLAGFDKHKIISKTLFLLFIFYAGLGLISPQLSVEDLLWQIPAYIAFLYFTFWRLYQRPMDRLVLAVVMMAVQFLVVYIFPTVEGYSGWLVFAFLLGRFLGIYHPQAHLDQPLDFKRKILGWLALAVFIVSFSPQPFLFEKNESYKEPEPAQITELMEETI